MVAPNPVDVLTRRVRDALRALSVNAFAEAPRLTPVPDEPPSRTDREQYRLGVLASVTFGLAWAAPLLRIAASTAFDWYRSYPTALEGFAAALQASLAEMVRHLEALVDRGDLDPAEPGLQLVKDAAEGLAERDSLAEAVEKAVRLYETGAHAPVHRLYVADCRTPYSVPLEAPTVYVGVIQPTGYEDGEWEYDLGSLSPDLATLRRRISAGFMDRGDDALVGLAEVLLVPAAANEDGASQTEICDAAVRAAAGRESYDLHSFMAAPAGISEIVSDYPIEPHPAGPIVRKAIVRLVLVRHIPLQGSD